MRLLNKRSATLKKISTPCCGVHPITNLWGRSREKMSFWTPSKLCPYNYVCFNQDQEYEDKDAKTKSIFIRKNTKFFFNYSLCRTSQFIHWIIISLLHVALWKHPLVWKWLDTQQNTCTADNVWSQHPQENEYVWVDHIHFKTILPKLDPLWQSFLDPRMLMGKISGENVLCRHKVMFVISTTYT